jgi:hypothetical protein
MPREAGGFFYVRGARLKCLRTSAHDLIEGDLRRLTHVEDKAVGDRPLGEEPAVLGVALRFGALL